MQKRLWWGVLIIIWLSHLIQVLTPEVGFDAVWYHLPVMRAVLSAQSLVYLPDLYQSLNPLGSDLIFGIGLAAGGELGAKVVAYLFGLGLVAASYGLARQFLNRSWSVITIVIISTFQVVAWQAASFYVDVAKAMWEIIMLWSLTNWHRSSVGSRTRFRWLVLAGLAMGLSLATKLFSLLLLPVVGLLVVWWGRRGWPVRLIELGSFLLFALLPPLPFYIWAYAQTGHPFYSFQAHLIKLAEIGGSSSLITYLADRVWQLPQFLPQLIWNRDYTSILLIIFMPLVIIGWRQLKTSHLRLGLFLFSSWQLGIWWFLPPTSTRYALSGFIGWLIISLWAAAHFVRADRRRQLPIIITIWLGVMINLAPRVWVNRRSLKYLLGHQTKTEYIAQFFDGHIDHHLIRWHQLSNQILR